MNDDYLDLTARILDNYGSPESVARDEGCDPADVLKIRTDAGLDPQTGDDAEDLTAEDSEDFDVDDVPEWERETPLRIAPTDPTPKTSKSIGGTNELAASGTSLSLRPGKQLGPS